MNNEIFKIVGSVLLEDKDFINGIKDVLAKAEDVTQKVAQKFKDAGKKITNVGKEMTIGLTAPIAGLIGLGAKYNIEMETLEANLGVLLGSTEKAHLKLEELRTMGAKTPFETKDLVKATQKMLAFGLDADKTNGYLQVLGDISMGDANKLDSLTLAFSQMGASGRASMEDVNQMIDQGFNPLVYICKKTGENMADLRDRVSEGKVPFEEIADAMRIATSEGGAFYGSMDRASETTAGRISTLKDNFGVMIGKLTDSLMPTIGKIIDKVAEWIDKFNSLDQGTKELILKVMLVIASLGPLLVIIGNVVKAIGTIITVSSKVVKVFSLVKKGITALGIAMGIPLGPILLIVGAIASVIAVFVTLWNKCEWFRNFWIGLWIGIKQSILGIADWINDNVIQPVINFFQGLWKGIKSVFDGIVFIINTFIQLVVSIFDAAFQLITLPFRFIWENCKDAIIFIFNEIMNFISFILSEICNIISSIFNSIWNVISTIMNAIWTVISTVWNTIYNTISIVINIIKNTISTVFNAIQSIISTIFNSVKNTVLTVWNAISFTISSIINGIKNTISNVFNNIKNIVSNTWNGIKDAIKKPIEKARDLVKNAIDKIKGFFHFEFKWPKLKMPHFGIKPKGWKIGDLLKGEVPKLGIEWYKKGGIFDRPTLFNTENGIKGVGEAGPEAVAPISELMKYTRLAVNESNAGIVDKLDLLISLLSNYLSMLLERQIVLDTGELVGAISSEMDKKLGDINRRKERGN